MRIAALAAALVLGAAAPASASALYETTPACELVTEAEAGAVLGQAMVKQGGMADPGLSDCTWNGPTARLELSLTEAALYAPSGSTASDEFDRMIKATTANHHPPELISGVGERAALFRSDDGAAWFLIVVAGGDYVSITLTGADRAAIIAIGQRAAARRPR